MNLKPRTKSGAWSVGLNAFFLSAVVLSIILVKGLGMLSYDDRWWDVAVVPLAIASISALVSGLVAMRKRQESSVLVYVSVVIGMLAVLFLLTHSLFISD